MIDTLQELYACLDVFFGDISEICARCRYTDCMGYIWLLPEEATNLYEKGLSILEVNDSISFINPFLEGEEIDIARLKPKCPHYKNSRCSIRNLRPLICRLYPFNFAVESGKIYLVLHSDCQYAEERNGDQELRNHIISLIKRINPELLSKILDCYFSYDAVADYRHGYNRFLKICRVTLPKPHPN